MDDMHAQQTFGTWEEMDAERRRIVALMDDLLGRGHYLITARIRPAGSRFELVMTLE